MPCVRPRSFSLASSAAGPERLAVDRHGIAALEIDRDVLRRVGRVLGIAGARIDIIGHLLPRVLEDLSLAAGVQQVGIGREGALTALVARDGDLVRLGEGDQRLAAGQVPLPPRRDDADVGLERVIAELEADLVVALARRAVADRVGPDGAGNLDLLLGDERPGDRGAEQILPLVQRIGAHHREDIVADELVAQVFDEDLADAEQFRLGAGRFDLLALAEVGGKGHHLAAVGLLQPFQDDAGVETAREREHDLLRRLVERRHRLPLRCGAP